MTDADATEGGLVFQVDWTGAGKRPDQLVTLLTRTLRQEFPETEEPLAVTHDPETNVVAVSGLDGLDDPLAKQVTHRARAIYNEFMTSPWY